MATRLTQRNMERLIQNELEPFLIRKGYLFYHEYHNCYFRKINDSWAEQFEIQSTSSGLGYSEHMICFFEVEKILLSVKTPGLEVDATLLERLRNRTFLMHTVSNLKLANQLSFSYEKPAKTESEIRFLAKDIIDYVETSGSKFIEKYSNLKNVLNEMDNLQKQGEGWHKILSGMAEHLFRGLIIAKLCNDPLFTDKVKYCDEKFYTIPLLINQGWIPYYENLKERLSNLNPPFSLVYDE